MKLTMKMHDYIKQVPGVNPDIDSYNFLLAIINEDETMGSLIVDHQIDFRDYLAMLAVTGAWLAIAIRGMSPASQSAILEHFKSVAQRDGDHF